MGTHQEDIALFLSRPMVIIREQSFGRTLSRAQGRSHLSRQHDRETRLDRCVITTAPIPASAPSIRQGKWLHETVPCLRGKSPECGRRGRVLTRARNHREGPLSTACPSGWAAVSFVCAQILALWSSKRRE